MKGWFEWSAPPPLHHHHCCLLRRGRGGGRRRHIHTSFAPLRLFKMNFLKPIKDVFLVDFPTPDGSAAPKTAKWTSTNVWKVQSHVSWRRLSFPPITYIGKKRREKKNQQVQKVLVCERGVTLLVRKHGGSRRMAPTGAAVPVAWRTCPPPLHLFIYLFLTQCDITPTGFLADTHCCLTNAFCVTNTQRANMSHVLTPPFTKFPCRRCRQTWQRRHPDFSSDDGPDSSIKTQIWWIIDVKRAHFSDLCRLERVWKEKAVSRCEMVRGQGGVKGGGGGGPSRHVSRDRFHSTALPSSVWSRKTALRTAKEQRFTPRLDALSLGLTDTAHRRVIVQSRKTRSSTVQLDGQ